MFRGNGPRTVRVGLKSIPNIRARSSEKWQPVHCWKATHLLLRVGQAAQSSGHFLETIGAASLIRGKFIKLPPPLTQTPIANPAPTPDTGMSVHICNIHNRKWHAKTHLLPNYRTMGSMSMIAVPIYVVSPNLPIVPAGGMAGDFFLRWSACMARRWYTSSTAADVCNGGILNWKPSPTGCPYGRILSLPKPAKDRSEVLGMSRFVGQRVG